MGDNLTGNRLGDIARDCTAEAPDTNFIHAYNLTGQVDQRTAAVARKDNGIVSDPADQFAHALSFDLERASRWNHGEIGNNSLSH